MILCNLTSLTARTKQCENTAGWNYSLTSILSQVQVKVRGGMERVACKTQQRHVTVMCHMRTNTSNMHKNNLFTLSAITEVLTLKTNCGISSLCLSYCFHVFFTKQNKTHKMSGHFCFLMRMFFCCLVRGGASEHGSRTDRQHSIKSGPRSWIIHLNGG